MTLIAFHNADVSFSLQQKTQLKLFLASLFKQEDKPLSQLTYIFCSDDYLLTINNNFLQHDYYTDIITFCLSEATQPVEGEIYISIHRVKENAKTHKTSTKHEMLRVMFHGALHLCGYKDKTKKQVIEMRSKEDYYLSSFLSNN